MNTSAGILSRPPALLAILLLCLLLYARVSQFELLNWDDQVYITHNPLVNGEGPALEAWKASFEGHYHPLVLLSLRFDHFLGDGDPQVFHLHNLILHLLNILLVWMLLRQLPLGANAPFWISLVFALHPLQVEAVAWATARKDVLYAFWFLLSLLLWLRYVREGRRLWYGLALLAFVLSLLSKGQAFVLAFLLPVAAHFLGGRPLLKAHRLHYLPFLVLAVAAALVAVWAQEQTGYTSAASYGVAPHWLAGNAAYALWSYVIRSLVPLGLSAYYPYPVPGTDLPVWLFWSALPLAAGLVIWSLWLWWKRNPAGLGLMIFLICMAPMLRLLPVSNFITADRYTYVGLIGLFIAFFHWAGKGGARLQEGVFAILALYLAVLTALRMPVWSDSLSLLNDTLTKHPRVVPALNSRGDVLLDQGKIGPAVADFSEAIRLRPDDARAYANRGRALAMSGDMQKALEDLDMALTLDPENTGVRLNRAMALANLGRYDASLRDLDHILLQNPGNRLATRLRQEVLVAMQQAK